VKTIEQTRLSPPDDPMPVSVVVLTLNEADNLRRCLESARRAAQIVVLDSGSTDATLETARDLGAVCHAREFDSFAGQRNWALDHCGLTQPWVLFLDADEELTDKFWLALHNLIHGAEAAECAGAYCCWKMMLRGRWLRRSDNFPKWQMRFIRLGKVRFVDAGHGQREGKVLGPTVHLEEPYLHHAFSKGWDAWLDRHNRYSAQEARERLLRGGGGWMDALRADRARRNLMLKPLVSRLPGWPLLRFLHAYLLKGGWREGREGFDYCLLMAFYEYLICLKMADESRQL
jgi:glycosyltransferase involved in cell wall biosynthesis